MHTSELLMPPSTASVCSAVPLSFSIAWRIAFVWKQVASIVALAICSFVVYCVIPTSRKSVTSTEHLQRVNSQMVPLASSTQYGANSPENAVTKTTPPLSGVKLAYPPI